MKAINILKHFGLITNHKWVVFKLSCKVGIPWRGLVHDLSKYSPIEFWEGVKYFNGKYSPIMDCKKEHGYSKAWLHHKGRNKHHAQYWTDLTAPMPNPVIPYQYAAEMVCDKIAAGMIYNGKDFKNDTELNYYMKEREEVLVNEQTDKFLIDVFTQVKERGVEEVLTRENIKETYRKNCTYDVNVFHKLANTPKTFAINVDKFGK